MEWQVLVAIDVEVINTAFVDLDINTEGKWQVQANVLYTSVDTTAEDIKHCPVIVAEAYCGVKRCPLRPSPDVCTCLFCDEAVPLALMLDHVAEHIKNGSPLRDAQYVGEAEPCGFCGRANGTCETTLHGAQVRTNCQYRYNFKYQKALEKKCNVPRNCPVPMCTALLFTLNIRLHLQQAHPLFDASTLDMTTWRVEKQGARRTRKPKKKENQRAPRITVQLNETKGDDGAQTTTTCDEGGDMYGTQNRKADEEEDWIPKAPNFDSGDDSMSNSPSTSTSGNGTASSSSTLTSSSASSVSDGDERVVIASGRKKAYKKFAPQAKRHTGKKMADKDNNAAGKATPSKAKAQKRQREGASASSSAKRQEK